MWTGANRSPLAHRAFAATGPTPVRDIAAAGTGKPGRRRGFDQRPIIKINPATWLTDSLHSSLAPRFSSLGRPPDQLSYESVMCQRGSVDVACHFVRSCSARNLPMGKFQPLGGPDDRTKGFSTDMSMHLALRPYVTAGIALVGASVIAVAPIAPHPDVPLPTVQSRRCSPCYG